MMFVQCWNGGPHGWMHDTGYRACASRLPCHRVARIPSELVAVLDLSEFPRPVPASPRTDGSASAARVPSAGTVPGLTGSPA